MTDDVFWELISKIAVSRQPDETRMLAPLRVALKKLSPDELGAFQDNLCRKLFALDTPKHYACTLEPSGDSYLYFRLFVVGNGETFYYDFLETPQPFGEPLPWLEGLLYAARNEYQRQTSTELDNPDAPNYESFSNPLWQAND